MAKAFCLFLSGLFLVVPAGYSTLALYNLKLGEKKTSLGTIERTVFTGWLVMELETGNIGLITCDAAAAQFGVSEFKESEFVRVNGPLDHESIVFLARGSIQGTFILKGLNYSADLFQNDASRIPKAFRITGVLVRDEAPAVSFEYAGNAILNRGDTRSAIASNAIFGNQLDTLRQALLQEGFLERPGLIRVDSDSGETNIATAGVWQMRSDGSQKFYGTTGEAFREAYADASPGETIKVGPGRYSIDGFLFDRSVHVTGAGAGVWDRDRSRFHGGTIFEGSLGYISTATNVLLADFAIECAKDGLFFSTAQSDALQLMVRDLAIGCISKANAHNVEFSGANITVEGLRSYNAGANSIVFKGVSNVVARALYSWNGANAVYVKASGWLKGNVRDVLIEGVISEQSGSVLVQAVDFPSRLENVSIRGVRSVSGHSGTAAAWIETGWGCSASNISCSEWLVSGGQRLATVVPGGGMSNIFLTHCEVSDFSYGPNRYPIMTFTSDPMDATQFRATNIRVNAQTMEQVGWLGKSSILLTTQAENYFSCGVLAGNVGGIYVTNAMICAHWPARWKLNTNFVVRGDPIRLPSGSLAGVYSNLTVGVAASADHPVPGIAVGDYYALFGPSAAPTGPYPVDTEIQPGKILALISMPGSFKGAEVSMQASAVNSIATTRESGRLLSVLKTGSASQISGTTTTMTATNAQIFPVFPWIWQSGARVYAGIFGGGADVAGWYPALNYGAAAEIETSGYEVNVTPVSKW
jgi:hypothetical protein